MRANPKPGMVMQTPCFEAFGTLAISYKSKTGVTYGYLGYNDVEFNRLLIQLLKEGLAEVAHPLLLPVLFFNLWIGAFSEENEEMLSSVKQVKKVTKKLQLPASDSFQEFDTAHDIIVECHDIINNGMAAFLTGSAANLQDALKNLPTIVASQNKIESSHRNLQALVSTLMTTLNCMVDTRARISERLRMQLQVVCTPFLKFKQPAIFVLKS
jgi:uncharacterized phage infection (PIP) family protein YhgE